MRLYLDDDMDANTLISVLQEEGHEVISPRAVAMRGAEDVAHLQYVAAHQGAVVTANARDFLTLHTRRGRRQDGTTLASWHSTGRIIRGVI